MGNVISAYDIMDALVCCDNGLKKCNVIVAYENEETRNNAVIFVRDTILLGKESQFTINVRGFKNNGRSTADIVGEIIKYDSYFQDLEIKGTLYTVRFWFSNAVGLGVDDVGRTIISLDIQVRINLA